MKLKQISCWLAGLVLTTCLVPKAFAQATYTNCKVGYSLQYDFKYDLIVGWDETFFLLHENKVLGSIKVNLVTIPEKTYDTQFPSNGTTRDSLFVLAIQEAKGGCASDGDDGSTYCKDTIQVTYLKTKTGVSAIKFFLIFAESTNIVGEKPKYKTIGPYYAVDISARKSCGKALLVSPRLWERASDSEIAKLDALIDSITIL